MSLTRSTVLSLAIALFMIPSSCRRLSSESQDQNQATTEGPAENGKQGGSNGGSPPANGPCDPDATCTFERDAVDPNTGNTTSVTRTDSGDKAVEPDKNGQINTGKLPIGATLRVVEHDPNGRVTVTYKQCMHEGWMDTYRATAEPLPNNEIPGPAIGGTMDETCGDDHVKNEDSALAGLLLVEVERTEYVDKVCTEEAEGSNGGPPQKVCRSLPTQIDGVDYTRIVAAAPACTFNGRSLSCHVPVAYNSEDLNYDDTTCELLEDQSPMIEKTCRTPGQPTCQGGATNHFDFSGGGPTSV